MENKAQVMTNTVISDSDVMARLANVADAQEVSEILAEKGINISAEAIDEFMIQQIGEGELNENQLETVAGGGGFKLRYLNPFYWVGRLLAWAVSKDMC